MSFFHIFFLATALLSILTNAKPMNQDDNSIENHTTLLANKVKLKKGPSPSCNGASKSTTFDVRAAKGQIFSMLTESEISSVVNWMISSSGLNIVAFDNAELNENYVMKVYAAKPAKEVALAYLAGTGPKPSRKAKVHLNMGGLSPPVLREYLVGPLPISASTVLTPVSYGGVTDIPFDSKMLDVKDNDLLETLILDTFKEIEDEVIDSYGTTYEDPCTRDECLLWINTAPRGPLRHEIRWFTFENEAEYSSAVGLAMVFDVSGVDSSSYSLLLITYNGHSFTSTADFKAAYNNPSWVSNKIPNRPLLTYLKSSKYGIEWSTLKKSPNPNGVHDERGAQTRLNSNLPAPQVSEPGGHRYYQKGNHVEYLGWSFFLSHDVQTGLALFDVRYRNERIAYEISLSEAAAVYSGLNDIAQSNTIYLDTAWGLGTCAAELILGVDCPSTSTLLDITFLENSGAPITKKNAVCIFESDDQIPLRKHYFGAGRSYGGLARTSLVVRTSLPVYNYDYLFDYVLYPNGAIEIRAVTTGYLQAAFTSPALSTEATNYSPSVHGFVAGTLHDHFFSFKIDLDVIKSDNKLLKTEIVVESVDPQDLDGNLYKNTVSSFAAATDYMTKKMVTSTVTNEEGFTIIPSVPTFFRIIEGTETNSWGSERGYKISVKGITQNLLANTVAHRALSFSKHSLIATKRHEDEERISSIYDQGDTSGSIMPTGLPLVDADRYLRDAENIEDQDIVLWGNFGVHHIPHAEDIPVTHTIGNSASIYLTPFNMFDYDDSLDLGNSVYSDRSCVDKPNKKCNFSYDLKTSCPIAYGVLASNLT